MVAVLIVTSFITTPSFLNHVSALTFGTIINLSSTSSGDSSVPQIIAAGNNVYVLWEDDDSGNDEILFVGSTDRGVTFSDSLNISTSPSNSFDPQLAVSKTSTDEVYAVWTEEGEIHFTSSADNGTSFGNPINVSNSTNYSQMPQVAVSGDDVYVAWEEDVSGTDTRDILVSATDNAGASFTDAVNLSNSSLQSSSAQLYASDAALYIVWKEFDSSAFVGNVFFSSSTDGGQTFSEPVNISGVLAGDAFFPQLAVSGSNVYVVWGDAINLDTFLAFSIDGGQTFSVPVNLSDSTFVFAANPDIVTSGENVYVVWQDEIAGLADIFIASITDSGGTIVLPVNVSNSSASFSVNPRIAASGTSPEIIYVVWQEDNPADVFLAVSTDGGANFDEPVNLSSSDSVGFSAFSQISASGDKLHVVWEDSSVGGVFEIFSRTITESGPPSISIDLVSDSTPRWDLDPVSISGTVNGDATDTITIEWGDGESDSGIPVEGSSWGPVSHPYGSASTGTREFAVKLFDESSTLKASASSEIEVQKHATGLTLDDIFSVVQDTDVTLLGTLTDTDANGPVDGRTISFTGTGVTAGLLPATTLADGTYSASGPSPDVVSDSALTVQAHFAGDPAYEASESNVMGYDTVAAGAAEFVIPAGEPSGPLDLTGFNASIVFDSVLSMGSIFVSECTAPQSARYIEIDGTCLKISSAVQLQDDSSAHITISYDGLSIPAGYSEENIDLFHEAITGIVDVTESRNTDGNNITGSTTDFSRFTAGIALHSDPPIGAERLPIFVGDNNDLLFEFPATRQLSFPNAELSIGNMETVSVTDPYANVDSGQVDTVEITLSSTSDPAGIIVRFHETGSNTATFEGSFSLTSGSSSSSQSELHAAPKDEISGAYEAPGMPPFRVIIDGVIEAGVAEVANLGIPLYLRPAPNSVDAYELRLIDARLGPDANVTIIMSYENFSGVSDPLELGISHSDPFDQANCLDVISSSSLDGIDTVAKTITGSATAVGGFALVHDDHNPADQECFALGVPPGGGGGGIPRPGTGIILLDSAKATAGESDVSEPGGSSGGGGGGGGSRSAGVTQIPSGNDVETSVTTELGPVTVRFESVQVGGGQLKVSSSQLSAFEHIFDDLALLAQDNDEHGIVRVDGAAYSTAGLIFEVDASQVPYQGVVEVTIPYDERTVTVLSGSESNVKFLHYDKETGVWEDATSSSDGLANTVTGVLDSLSPVVAAVIIDQGVTFDERYFEDNPLARLAVTSASFSISAEAEVELAATLNNMQGVNQDYFVVVQVLNENGIAQYIEWEKGSLASGGKGQISMIWKPEARGTYEVQVFVWDNADNPSALSNAILKDVMV
jgi:hypothetical protein